MEKTPNVLLIGNGINRAFGSSSWDSVISAISTGEFESHSIKGEEIKKLPYPLQTMVVSNDSVDKGMKLISNTMISCELSVRQKNMLTRLASLPFEAILTTNYSYEIETSLDDGFKVKQNCASRYRKSTRKGNSVQEKFGIFKYNEVADKKIWHIHGEAAHVNSMIMGHYYYGKLLAEIQKRIPGLFRERAMAEKRGYDFTPVSWIDYFLLGNVYIVGMGLDPSEMDIWWLINCKKKDFGNDGKIVFYEPNLSDESKYAIKALADINGIDCVSAKLENADECYIRYYDEVIGQIEERLT